MISERQRMIYELVSAQGEVSNNELRTRCANVSNMTLWRDLKKLEEMGLISRVRGGARSMQTAQTGVSGGEGVYTKRSMENLAAKRAIAETALSLLTPGRSIFMDAGSTMMSLAQIMPDNGYTILTVGVNIATELAKRPSCTVICSGGRIDTNTLACYGPETENFLDHLNIDLFLMASSSYAPSSGFTCGSQMYGELRRRVIEKSARTVVLMDHTKIGRRLPYSFASFADIDEICTDVPLPEEVAAQAGQYHVKVNVAGR